MAESFRELVIVESLDNLIQKNTNAIASLTKELKLIQNSDKIKDGLKLYKNFIKMDARDYVKAGGTSSLTREYNKVAEVLISLENDLIRLTKKIGELPLIVNLLKIFSSMMDRVEDTHRDIDIEYNKIVLGNTNQRDYK